MQDFYTTFISPASPQRSKLSVHLQAQSKPKEPTLDETKAAAVAALQVILTEHKIESAPEDLKTHINDTASAEAIPDAVSTYLSSTLKLEQEVADKVLDAAKAAMGVADSGLPAEPEVLDGSGGAETKDAQHPVLITDIHAWKAGVQVSAGVRPVKPLEEFVEVAEKL
jgi:insulysin